MTVQSVALVWNHELERYEEPLHRQRFLQLAQVPEDWLAAAAQLPGKALAVGLSIWMLSIAVRSKTVMVTPANVGRLGVDASAKSRALTALERAGLISLRRRRGRFPEATLITTGRQDVE